MEILRESAMFIAYLIVNILGVCAIGLIIYSACWFIRELRKTDKHKE